VAHRPDTSVLAALLGESTLNRQGLHRYALLVTEGLLYTGVALLLTARWARQESGVFAIFLTAGALTSQMKELLDENRRNIYERDDISNRKANTITALSVMSLFIGVLITFAIAGAVLGSDAASHRFAFALKAADIGSDSILNRSFGSIQSIGVHNLIVLASIWILSFLYRAFGLLIALVWNASVWALVLTFLIQRGVEQTSTHAFLFVTTASAAVLPHLILEALAYIIGALGAVYMSIAVAKYEPKDAQFRGVAKAVVQLSLFSLAWLLVAAALEAYLPPAVLSLVS